MTSTFPVIGVLGGMGPAATADFYRKLIEATPARCDQEHLPVLIHALPQIPDRAASFLHGAPSPAPMLSQVARQLQASGASLIVIPCNTAHLWHDVVAQAVQVPVLHIVDPVLQALGEALPGSGPIDVGLLGTAATVQGELYPQRSEAVGARSVRWLAPDGEAQRDCVDAGIRAVKAGRLEAGRALLREAARSLVARGAQALVFACTEVPLALEGEALGVPAVDATQRLALATVAWAMGRAAAVSSSHC
jgi:aspartate racemase